MSSDHDDGYDAGADGDYDDDCYYDDAYGSDDYSFFASSDNRCSAIHSDC